jgi:hypothetical protein
VLAVAETELATLEEALERAEAQPSRAKGRRLLLEQVIDMAVSRRRWVRALQNDPVMIRLLAQDAPLAELMERVYGLLMGDTDGPEAQVRAAMMSAAIGATVVHPLVDNLDEETLRTELLRVARRLFGVTG